MSKPSTASSPGAEKPKRARKPSVNHYVVKLWGCKDDTPVLVTASTQKKALDAVVKIRAAENADLIAAGRSNWTIIDADHPAQLRVDCSVATQRDAA